MSQMLVFSDKRIKWIGFITLAVLGIFSYFFYLERTILLDAAYQTFAIIYHDSFAIQNDRFGAVVTKWLPYLAYRGGLSIDTILRLYSIGFILFYLVLYALLTRIKNERMAIVVLLFYTLLVSHTFYWIQSEQLQGTGITLFSFGLVISCQPMRWFHFPLYFALIYVIVFIHPLMFIPFGYIWLFFLIHYRWYAKIGYYLLPLAFAVIQYYKLHAPQVTDYDQLSYSLINNLYENFQYFFQLKSNSNFLWFCVTDYYFFPVIFVATIIYYIVRQRWLKLILCFFATAGYVVLINGAFPWGAEQFYIESFYHLLTVFLALPLVFDVLPGMKWTRRNAFYILIFIFAVRLVHIGNQRKVYKRRLEWNLAMLEKTKEYSGTKFLINEKDIDKEKYLMAWGSAFETLLLWSRQHPDSTRTFFIFNEGAVPWQEWLEKKKAYLTPFGAIPYDGIPKNYFNFTDTSRYKLLEKEDLVGW